MVAVRGLERAEKLIGTAEAGQQGRATWQRLLTARELDRRLRLPAGESASLAKNAAIPSVTLPDGQIRFDPREIDRWLGECTAKSSEVSR